MAIPVLAAAFTVTRPVALPTPATAVRPEFDSYNAARLARELATLYPDRSPGAAGSRGAAGWAEDQLSRLGLETSTDVFSAKIPGRSRTQLRNITAIVPGRSRDAIVVVAHRDATKGHPGTNNNASGAAALIELARGYTATRRGPVGGASPSHTLVFASTDGGAYGQLGAHRLAKTLQTTNGISAVVVLDAIASSGRPRIVIAGRGPHSAAPGLLATVSSKIAEQTGSQPTTAGVLGQLLDLAFPFSLTEQSAFLAAGIPAITISTGAERPAEDALRQRLDIARLGQIGRAAETSLASLDASMEPVLGTRTYLYIGGRTVPGWALSMLYVALLVPFAVAGTDLLVRLRRRRIPMWLAVRTYLRRLTFWLWAGALFYLFAVLGAWPRGDAAPVNPASQAAGHWPRLAIFAYTVILLLSWLVARARLVRRGPVSGEQEVAGMAAALAALMAISLVLIITNISALLFILPSAHAWLFLVQARTRRAAVRAALYVAGLLGPIVLVGSFAVRFGLGLDAPWYLAELTATGYVSPLGAVIFLAWLAVAAQMLAVVAGRYAPYPAPADRPARSQLGTAIAAIRHPTRKQQPS
jgi:hypothetical protein